MRWVKLRSFGDEACLPYCFESVQKDPVILEGVTYRSLCATCATTLKARANRANRRGGPANRPPTYTGSDAKTLLGPNGPVPPPLQPRPAGAGGSSGGCALDKQAPPAAPQMSRSSTPTRNRQSDWLPSYSPHPNSHTPPPGRATGPPINSRTTPTDLPKAPYPGPLPSEDPMLLARFRHALVIRARPENLVQNPALQGLAGHLQYGWPPASQPAYQASHPPSMLGQQQPGARGGHFQQQQQPRGSAPTNPAPYQQQGGGNPPQPATYRPYGPGSYGQQGDPPYYQGNPPQ